MYGATNIINCAQLNNIETAIMVFIFKKVKYDHVCRCNQNEIKRRRQQNTDAASSVGAIELSSSVFAGVVVAFVVVVVVVVAGVVNETKKITNNNNNKRFDTHETIIDGQRIKRGVLLRANLMSVDAGRATRQALH